MPNATNSPGSAADISPCRAALEWMVAQLNGRQLYEFIKSWQYLSEEVLRGFKLSAANADKKIVRKRVVTQLQRNPELTASLLQDQKTPWYLRTTVLLMLDIDWLTDHWRMLVRATGDRNFVIALACEDDAALARRGVRLLNRSRFWENEMLPKAEDTPPEWQALVKILPEAAPDSVTDDTTRKLQTERDKALARQHALEVETEKLKQALDKQKKRTAAEAEQKSRAETATEQEKQRIRCKLKECRNELHTLHTSFQEELENRVQQYRKETLGITDYVERIEAELRSDRADSLLRQARDVLEAHRRLNEKHGTLSELRRQIEALEKTDDALAECALESVMVLPELHQVQQSVRARLDELRELIPEETGFFGARQQVRQILKMIRDCTLANQGLKRLADIDKQLTTPLFSEVIGCDNMQLIHQALRQQKERLRKIDQEQKLAQVMQPASNIESPELPAARHIWDIEGELSRNPQNSQPVLYIDGYNGIKGTTSLTAVLNANGLAAARRRLCELLNQVHNRFDRIDIVYDGTEALQERETHGNITEIFAARLEESQNADNYITQHLHSQQEANRILWLVTADGGLRARNRSVCHAFLDPQDLLAFLENE